jgi:hypothetical protein
LCSQDSIFVVDGQGRESRACRLGPFYTITTDELRTLVENSRNSVEAEPQPADDEDESSATEEATEEPSDP